MTAFDALFLIEKLICIALILQTIEFLKIHKQLTDDGIWSWKIIRDDYQNSFQLIRSFFDFTLSYNHFIKILYLRLLSAFILLPLPPLFFLHTLLIIYLLFTTFLISIRWRGTFNGGSDYMTTIVLLGLSFAFVFHNKPNFVLGSLWYIALQTCLSFFISGLSKLNNHDWLIGRALKSFIALSNYGVPNNMQKCMQSKFLIFSLSWFVMIFEILFPLSLIYKPIALMFICFAMLFHLLNFYLFGLNRFIFAWAAAYPALFFVANKAPLLLSSRY